MKKTTILLYPFALMLVVISILSCTETMQVNNSYILRLKNRGIVPLSTVNPYIAANALITKEMERSPELKGFIEHSGAPAALRVEQGLFSPLYIELFYPAKNEFFTAEDNNGIWLINGPFQIEKDTMTQVKKVLIFNATSAKVPLPSPAKTVPGPKFPSPGEFSSPKESAMQIATSVPTVVNSPKATVPATQAQTSQAVSPIEALSKRFGNAKAEITPKGDIVHYVSYPGETIPMLARWYTFDATNVARIMRINHIEGSQALSIGDSVVIPGYLVKNKNILTQDSLSALEAAVADGSIK